MLVYVGAIPITMSDYDSILPEGRGVWVPIDHGVSDYPAKGLENLEETIAAVVRGGADAIIAHKGVISAFGHLHPGHMIAHLSASTRHGGKRCDDKVLVGSCEEMLSRGAVAVSVQVNLGSEYEAEMIERMGAVTEEAHLLGMPSLGMVYARGTGLNLLTDDDTKGIAHAVRLGFELGCDVVKTSWTGNASSFAKVTAAVPIPVLIAGGDFQMGDLGLLEMIHQAIVAGAAGVCMGRQIFTHPSPEKITRAIVQIVHEGATAEEAFTIL